MSDILPLVQNAQLVTQQGNFTVQFKLYLDSIQQRIGGISGGIYVPLSISSSAFTWDLNSAPIASVTLVNGTNTMSVVNQVAGFVYPYRITVIQPSSGAAGTISWPASFKWPGGTKPTLSSGNNAIDMFAFVSDGTNMYVITEGLNYS